MYRADYCLKHFKLLLGSLHQSSLDAARGDVLQDPLLHPRQERHQLIISILVESIQGCINFPIPPGEGGGESSL